MIIIYENIGKSQVDLCITNNMIPIISDFMTFGWKCLDHFPIKLLLQDKQQKTDNSNGMLQHNSYK